jgi:hypothetical protein
MVRGKRFHGARQTNNQAIRGMRFFRTATGSVIDAPHDENLRTSHQIQTSAASGGANDIDSINDGKFKGQILILRAVGGNNNTRTSQTNLEDGVTLTD